MLSIFREKILKSNFGSIFEFWGNIGIRYKSYFLTPKGTSLCDYASYESLTVKIHQKPQERHKTSNLPICPEVLCKRILTKFGTWGRWSDVINCAEFFGNQFGGFDSVGVKVRPFALTSTVDAVLRYSATLTQVHICFNVCTARHTSTVSN